MPFATESMQVRHRTIGRWQAAGLRPRGPARREPRPLDLAPTVRGSGTTGCDCRCGTLLGDRGSQRVAAAAV